MKALIKNVLKRLHLYHPLQGVYRLLLLKMANNFYRLTYAQWKGRGFQCNFCNAQYEKFVPEHPSRNIKPAIESNHVIAGFGDHVYCPNCMSKNRERLVKAVLDHRIGIAGQKILHFSPERNLYNYLKRTADVQTADIAPGFYRIIDKQITAADATRLPFADETFDMVIANHVLEHIPDDASAMREFCRVLKKGGFAILQVPYSTTLSDTIEQPYINDPSGQERLYGQKDHVRIYARADYVRRLSSAGFSVDILVPEQLAAYRIHAIQESENVFLCARK